VLEKLSKTCVLYDNGVSLELVYDFYECFAKEMRDFGLICIHDFLENRLSFTDFAFPLSQQVSVACLDLPGHGQSGRAYKYEMNIWMQACISVVNACNFRKVVWVGTGLGSAIALEMANAAPFLTAAVVLEDVRPISKYSDLGIISKIPISKYKNFADLAQSPELPITSFNGKLNFAIHNFEAEDDHLVTTYDPALLTLNTETLHTSKLLENLKHKSLIFNRDEVPLTLCPENITVCPKSSQIGYDDNEKGLISKWIQKVLTNVKYRFAIGFG